GGRGRGSAPGRHVGIQPLPVPRGGLKDRVQAMQPPPPDPGLSGEDLPESPRHGFHGGRGAPPAPRTRTTAPTIALSRGAGARGGTIARRVGRKLSWQVYDQELLEYMAQEATFSPGVLEAGPSGTNDWTEQRLAELVRDSTMSNDVSVLNLARVV